MTTHRVICIDSKPRAVVGRISTVTLLAVFAKGYTHCDGMLTAETKTAEFIRISLLSQKTLDGIAIAP